MDRDEIMTLTVQELREHLTRLGLATTGLKPELQNRLLEHVQQNDDGEESVFEQAVDQLPRAIEGVSHFTLKDIGDSLTSFTGTGLPDINDWLQEFEENAETIRWNSLQKYIYAKQLLKGTAKAFLRSQSGICDWVSLKSALLNEFGDKLSAIDVHRLLRNRQKKQNETLREYLYSLMEIGKQIDLDEESIIEYFVDGIPDSRINKSSLYHSTNINELKDNIKVYEKIRGTSQRTLFPKEAKSTEREVEYRRNKPAEDSRRCFKCGDKGHDAKSCEAKGFKCFNCQQFGHRSFECKETKRKTPKSEKENVHTLSSHVEAETGGRARSHPGQNRIFKEIVVNGVPISALVDTGSDICAIRYDTLMMLGDIELQPLHRVFIGVGQKQITTLGCFSVTLALDKTVVDVTFHVVRERDLLYNAVIGNDILKYVDLVIDSDNVTFKSKKGKIESAVGEGKFGVPVSVLRKAKKTAVVRGQETVHQKIDVCKEFESMCLHMVCDGSKSEGCDLSHLGSQYAAEVEDMLTNYHPVKPTSTPIKMRLILLDEVPVSQRPRRLPYADQQIVEKQVQEWLRDGIVKPSFSEYASPVVLVSKKDGTKRLCCDYRKLNEKIARDHFPMPLIDDILHKLQDAEVYTTLDLRNGFFHVPLEEDSTKYTSFVTHNGQFEFLFVPFGISNSPAVFSRYIAAVFRDLIHDGTVIIYIDDIVIPSKSEREGIDKLQKVLKVAESHGLQIKWSKCQILQRKVTFLGYVIENASISPSEGKIKAVSEFPVPRDKKALQRFLGLTSYFRRFMENYALMAKPLTDLLVKGAVYKIGDEENSAFQQMKTALVEAPVLKLFDMKRPTEVHTDASMDGYGGILLQKDPDDQQWHPVQYMSRRTTPCERKYHSYELEVLAVIEAVKKWRVYLLGLPFKIVTDCNAFTMTLKKQDVPLRVSRWAMYLQDFNLEIEHRSGTKMRHVDALSRVCCLMLTDSLHHRLKEAQMRDGWIKAIRKVLEKEDFEDFFVKCDVLHKDPIKEQVVVPSAMEEEVIKIAHRQGHFAKKKTQDLIEKTFYIPDLTRKVNEVVRSCIECIVTEAKAGKKEGFLNPIDKADRPLGTFHVDHVGPMESTHKLYNHILVVVDAFSKFVWLYPTKSTGANEVIDRLSKQSATFGNPKRIISDRGSAFTSQDFKQYCEEQGIQHLLIATGVPRGNGQVERMHRIVVPMLSKLCVESPKNWYKHVERVQQNVNNSPSRSTGFSPFRILTGLEMRVQKNEDIRRLIEEADFQEYDEERDLVREEAREAILKVQEENRRGYNQKRKPETQYNVNDLVAIKRTQFGSGLKLKPNFLGPYKVIEKLNRGRYRVQKVGDFEGPFKTYTVAEFMKRWDFSFEPNELSGRPNVGSREQRQTRSGQQY